MMFAMTPTSHVPDNNGRLRQLVQASGLASAVALTVFNRGRAAAPCKETEWRGYLAEEGHALFRPLPDDMLAHAEHQFSLLEISK
jgi:hypothetical protein